MTSRKINEAASDIDDASDTIDELRAKPNLDAETTDMLDELHNSLEHASDSLDDAAEAAEIEDDDARDS